MDEDIAIIDSKTRNEKIKNFLINNKKLLILSLLFTLICFISYFVFEDFKEKEKIKISDKFNTIIIDYSQNNKKQTEKALIELIERQDSTYSPLSLYFIIDNKIIDNRKEINQLFDTIIKNVSLETEVRNLLIYKKALYNADNTDETELLNILKPIINSESIWKAHGLYLMGEYFYSKNEKQKSKDFFDQMIMLENINPELSIKAKKRLNRDLSD